MDKPKSINALMAYMRDEKNISIHGSTQKLKLRYMGYFHGYKGYRYCSINVGSSRMLPYSSFSELQAVYEFDTKLKSLMYEKIMFLETAIKNFALEEIIAYSGSSSFAEIFSKQLTSFKSYPINSGKRKEAMSTRFSLRTKIYDLISRDCRKPLVSHYYDRDRPVPIWAIFELMSMGEFGVFIQCLNPDVKRKISCSLGIKRSLDADGEMPLLIVYALKDLRNAVAHNGVLFDTRFKTGGVGKRLSAYLEQETHIPDIRFDTITDYVILVAFCLKCLRYGKKDILSFIKQFEDICENLNTQIPFSLFSSILSTSSRNEIAQLKKYI